MFSLHSKPRRVYTADNNVFDSRFRFVISRNPENVRDAAPTLENVDKARSQLVEMQPFVWQTSMEI